MNTKVNIKWYTPFAKDSINCIEGTHVSKEAHPILFDRLLNNIIWVEKEAFIGRADDGEYVTLGHIHDAASLEVYLQKHPTGRYW